MNPANFRKADGLLALGLAALALALTAGVAGARDRDKPSVIIAPEAIASATDQKFPVLGRTFVPLHSTLVGQGGVTRLNFSGTLSVHNASSANVLAIDRIEYRSGAGEVIETYVDAPIYLKPYASIQIAIAQDDTRAGVGASFTVDWSTPAASDEPVIEAAMASFIGTHSYSFLSPGRRVSRPQ